MTRVRRFDRAEARWDKAVSLPNGWVRVPVTIGRVGVFEYRDDAGKVVREYRPPEEVGRADSVASFEGAPITVNHPPLLLDASNTHVFQRGSVQNVRYEGGEVRGDALLTGKELVDASASTHRQVSPGYTVEVDDSPGVTPGGERYDRVQRSITGNHVAAVPAGRQGDAVAFRFDAAETPLNPGDAVAITQDKTMKKIRIDGKEYELPTAAADALIKEGKAEEVKADADPKPEAKTEPEQKPEVKADEKPAPKADDKGEDPEKIRAKLDSALERMEEMEKRADERLEVRTDLVATARRCISDTYSGRGKSDREIRSDVIGKVLGDEAKAKLEGRSDGYVEGRYETALERLAERANRGDQLLELARRVDEEGDPNTEEDPVQAAKKRMDEDRANAWKAKEAS